MKRRKRGEAATERNRIMKKKSKDEIYAVIGLGRFGLALARGLAEGGKEIIAVDRDPAVINQAMEFTENAFITGDLSRENLRKIGIQNCDVVVVGIGGTIDVSILVTLTVIQLGVARVIAKATSAEQGCVLEKLGAEVIYPERDMGIRLANRLIAPQVLEYIALSDDISITEIQLPLHFAAMNVQEIHLRQKYGLNIIAVLHEGTVATEITPDTVLYAGDRITVVGKTQQVTKLESDLQRRR